MAQGHLLISDDTFFNYSFSDELAAFFGLPTEVPDPGFVIDPADPDAEPPMLPKTWTFYTAAFESGVNWPAGEPFPVLEDEDGVPMRQMPTGEVDDDGNPEYRPFNVLDHEQSDWVYPINSQIFKLATLVVGLCQAKPIPLHAVLLLAEDTVQYLQDGALPEAIV